MRAIDTNVVVRILVRDEPEQAAAADAYIGGGAWVSLLVLMETTWVLRSVYDRTAAQIATGLELLLDHESIVVQDADLAARALAEFQKRPSIGFSDCLIVEQARKSGHVPIGTFDRALARLPGVTRVK
ncbi:MAG: PIN domain-containing protein [Gemmatimonadaceae bacterium]